MTGRVVLASSDELDQSVVYGLLPARYLAGSKSASSFVSNLGKQIEQTLIGMVELTLETSAQMHRQRRRATFGRYGDLQVAGSHDRCERELAVLRVIGRVDPYACGQTVLMNLTVDVGVIGAGDHQRVVGHLAYLVRALLNLERPDEWPGTERRQVGIHSRTNRSNPSAGFEQLFDLPNRHVAGTDTEDRLAIEAKVYRIRACVWEDAFGHAANVVTRASEPHAHRSPDSELLVRTYRQPGCPYIRRTGFPHRRTLDRIRRPDFGGCTPRPIAHFVLSELMLASSPQLSTIDQMIDGYRRAGQRMVVSSSFQTHSIPLLHILHTMAPEIPVAFLDTGYHFEETITFRDEIVDRLDLNLVIVRGNEAPATGLYITSENQCCTMNKVEPMHELLANYDVWVSGVRAEQTSTRGGFAPTMPGPIDTERYHPMLSWTTGDIEAYRGRFDLPAHPLDALGYRSIGCSPCTSAPTVSTSSDEDRTGRWSGTAKTECGLHSSPART